MHKKSLASLAQSVEKLAAFAISPAGTEGMIVCGRKTPSFSLSLTKKKELLDLIDRLYTKEGWSTKYSRKKIESLLLDLVGKCLASPSGILQEVNDAASEYKEFAGNIFVAVPIIGVILDQQIRLGEVTIACGTQELLNQLANDMAPHMVSNVIQKDSSLTKEFFASRTNSHLVDHLLGKCFAWVTESAEPIRATELAVEKTRRAIDILRYSALLLYRNQDPASIGLIGEAVSEYQASVSVDAKEGILGSSSKLIFQPFIINQDTLLKMEDIGVSLFSEIIRNQNRSEFEAVLVNGLRWLAYAQTQVENEIRLLNIVNCLECLFKPKKSDPITNQIAEGVAFLIGEDLATRKMIKKRVKDIYSTRSKLTHEGVAEVSSDLLMDVLLLAGKTIRKLVRLHDAFANHDTFLGWIEDQKLSALIQFPEKR